MPNTSHDLIPLITKREHSEQWVDARTLHHFLEIGKDFSNWIKDYIAEFGFVEGVDFSPNLAKSTGGRQAIEYTLTMDMAKELSMLQRNEKGKQARQYFIAAEKKLRQVETAMLATGGAANPFDTILQYCRKQQHDGKTWYAANQLRRLCGRGGNIKEMVHRLNEDGRAKLLPEANQEKWYVTKDAIPDLLALQPSNLVNLALIEMIKAGGAKW